MNKYNIIDFIFTVEELFLFNVLYGKKQPKHIVWNSLSIFIYLRREDFLEANVLRTERAVFPLPLVPYLSARLSVVSRSPSRVPNYIRAVSRIFTRRK